VPEIVGQDDQWILVNKPAGWLSVPPSQGAPESRSDLKTWLKEQGLSCFPVHRLDVETSGLILFAKNQTAHKLANQWFELRRVKKTYAFFAGPAHPHSWNASALAPIWKVQTPIAGKDSQTRVETQRIFDLEKIFYGLANPLTGRRHQIRIHLAQSGYPLLGDREYGGSLTQFSRVALHALSLEFPEMIMGKKKWEMPLPADFQELMQELESTSSLAQGKT